MTLSVLQAFAAKESGQISWDEYLHILLARCTGDKHEDDDVEGTYPKLRFTDPFGHVLFMWSNRMDTIDDASALEAVFNAYRYGSLNDVKSKMAFLQDAQIPNEGITGMKKSLMLLSCQERRPDVLKYCLDEGGFPIEGTMEDEAKSVDAGKDPQTFNTLWQSRQFQQIQEGDEYNRRLRKERAAPGNRRVKKWKKGKNGNLVPCTCGAPPGAEATFDVGGRFPVDW